MIFSRCRYPDKWCFRQILAESPLANDRLQKVWTAILCGRQFFTKCYCSFLSPSQQLHHHENHPHKHHHQKHPHHHHDVSCLFVAALIGRCNKLLLHRQRQHQQSNANNIFRRHICLPKKYVLGLLFITFIVIFSWNIWKPGILRPNPR